MSIHPLMSLLVIGLLIGPFQYQCGILAVGLSVACFLSMLENKPTKVIVKPRLPPQSWRW